MRVFCNTGEGNKRDGYTVLICKGKYKGGRYTVIKKNVWNKKVPVLFQKTPG